MNPTHRLKYFRLSVLTVFDHEELPGTLTFWKKKNQVLYFSQAVSFYNILKPAILTK